MGMVTESGSHLDGPQTGWVPHTGNVMCLDSRKLEPRGTQRGYSRRRPERMEWNGRVWAGSAEQRMGEHAQQKCAG